MKNRWKRPEEQTFGSKVQITKDGKGRVSLPKYVVRAWALYSLAISFNVSKTIPRPAKALHTSLSAGDSSSRALALSSLGCSVQYRGKPSKAVGSCLALHTLKNFPFVLGAAHPKSHPLRRCTPR